MVRKSLQALTIEGDAELARSVLTMDDAVDQMNRAAFRALTKVMEDQSHLAPQALNALMICRSLERVGDHATNIAEDVIFWIQGADVRHHKSVMKAAALAAAAAGAAATAASPAAEGNKAGSVAPVGPVPNDRAPIDTAPAKVSSRRIFSNKS